LPTLTILFRLIPAAKVGEGLFPGVILVARGGASLKKLTILLAILAGAALLVLPFASATPEFSKKENVSCTHCHVGVGREELNETGKCYKKNNSLKGCPAPPKSK
jgi:hypothetical protein